jgi:hypothetical protein
MTMTYRIERMYFSDDFDTEVIRTGLTLEEAQEWCSDPETSSRTATLAEGVQRTARRGPWFDGYTEE